MLLKTDSFKEICTYVPWLKSSFYQIHTPGLFLESKGMRAIFQKKGKKGKIFDHVGKYVQKFEKGQVIGNKRLEKALHPDKLLCLTEVSLGCFFNQLFIWLLQGQLWPWNGMLNDNGVNNNGMLNYMPETMLLHPNSITNTRVVFKFSSLLTTLSCIKTWYIY